MSNINIFIGKKKSFFFVFPFSHTLPCFCVCYKIGWHFPYIYFMPFHYWLFILRCLYFRVLKVNATLFFCLHCDKKRKYLWLETWKIHRRFPIFYISMLLFIDEKRAMSTVSTVSFIEHENIRWSSLLGGVLLPLLSSYSYSLLTK
jgi:hypothetical protein